MKKRIFATLFALLMLVSAFSVIACAQPDNSHAEELPAVIDQAGILEDHEIKDIDEKLNALSKEYGIAFVAVTVEEYIYTPLNDIADALYTQGGYMNAENGNSVFCIYQHGGEGEREIVIVRYGDKAKDEFSDSDCSEIIDAVKPDFADGKYLKAFSKFTAEAEKVLNPTVHWIWIILCPAIGFVIAFIIMKVIASANKSVRRKVNAADYVSADSLTVTNAADIFLYSQVSSVPKSTNNTTSSNTRAGGRSTSSGKF